MGAHMLAQYHMIITRTKYDAYIDVDVIVEYTQSGVWFISALSGLLWMRHANKYRNVQHSMRKNTIRMGKGTDTIMFTMYMYFMSVSVWFVLTTDEIDARDATNIDESFWHANLQTWIWGAITFAFLSIVLQMFMITKNISSTRKQQLDIKVEKT